MLVGTVTWQSWKGGGTRCFFSNQTDPILLKRCTRRFSDIELVCAGVGDGDCMVHVRRCRQIVGENEKIPAQHERGGIKMR